MTAKVFEAALGIAAPWSVDSVEFDEGAKLLTVLVDFEPGTPFAADAADAVCVDAATATKPDVRDPSSSGDGSERTCQRDHEVGDPAAAIGGCAVGRS